MNFRTFSALGRSVVVLVALLLLVVGANAAEKTTPDWYREGPTLGDTLLDSKIELSRITQQQWAAAGFEEKSGRPFPKFLETSDDWAWREVEVREQTYEFATGGRKALYVGAIDRFGGQPFGGGCRFWAVDREGKRTAIDYNTPRGGVVTRQEKSIHNHPQVWEYTVTLPAGTETFVIEKLHNCEPWPMGWVDDRSRIELVTESLTPFGQLAQLVDDATRQDPRISRAGNRETGTAKICCGPLTDYANMARRYYWDLPVGQQEVIDGYVQDRTKIDRKTLLKIRTVFVNYHAILEPRLREYRDIRFGSQFNEFKSLIEQTDDIPRSKALLPRLEALRTEAAEVERGMNGGRATDLATADRLITELLEVKIVLDLECRLKLAHKTLEYVQRSKPLPAEAKQLSALTGTVERAGAEQFPELIEQLKTLRRRIILQHPDLQFEKLLVCKNHHPGPGHMCDQYLGRHARPGKGLFVVEDWLSDEPKETCITEDLPEGYYHHADLSYDATRVAFGFCNTTVEESRQQRHWIYEAAIDGSGTRQLTGTLRDQMQRVEDRKTVVIEDWDPCYLPNGSIAFTSTRSQSYGRCHGGRYVPAYILFGMDGDGSNIRRLSFGEANEWDPSVLGDGRLVFTRWDYINRHDTRYQGLWTTHPDGTRTAHYYGSYSTSPCMIAEAEAIPGTNKIVATATDHHGYTQGSIIIIDVSQGEDGWEPLTVVTPEIAFPEARYDVMHWMPKLAAPRVDSSSTRGLVSRARAMAPYPINDTLFLCAYAPNGGDYRICLVDTLGGREVIYDKDVCSAAIPIRPRLAPRVIPSGLPQGPTENSGRLVIQDIYENRHATPEHPLQRGEIRSLRVNLVLTQPTRNHWARGSVSNEVIKRPLGTVPVDSKGSVAFEAPAGVPLQLQALDENGMAVMTMRSFIYLHPGETQTCVGCHEQRNSSPRPVAASGMKVHQLEPVPGVDYDDMAFSFTRTVQPVLDRHCIGCHGLGQTAEDGKKAPGSYVFSVDVDDSSDNPKRFDAMPTSYRQLLSHSGARLAHRNGETETSVPRDYFSPTSKLPPMLLAEHYGLTLDRESFARIITWLDLNSQCYGTYLPNREEQRIPDTAGEAALRTYVAGLFGTELATQPLGALVNPADLDESRILQAPLPTKHGGWAQITNGYTSPTDPRYTKMRDLASSAYQPMPYQDLAGTCGREPCLCGNCWIREMVDEDVYRAQLKAKLAAKQKKIEAIPASSR
ncbi:MAG: hypothetical protein V3R99_08020 [Thermoguttaceae bacterium]